MQTKNILSQLKAERGKLDKAIELLEGGEPSRPTRRPRGKRRRISKAERDRRSKAQRARWDKAKKEQKAS